MAGLHHLALSEWNADACATLRAAGLGEVLEGDVRAVDWTPYAGKVDVMWGSPPCQDFSTAGKRLGAKGERNGFPWLWTAVDAVRPEWLIVENVEALTFHTGDCARPRQDPMKCPACYLAAVIIPEALRRFAWVEWRVLNAADYGVPQHRYRWFMVCGPHPIRWPASTHCDPAELRQAGLFGHRRAPWRTVREALGWTGQTQSGVATSDPGTHGRPQSCDDPSPTVSGSSTIYHHPTPRKPPATYAGHTGNVPDKPAKTVKAGVHGVGGGEGVLHTDDGPRQATVAETAILQDFPADWPFQGTKTSKMRQAGNAVPATMARVLGEAVRIAGEALAVGERAA